MTFEQWFRNEVSDGRLYAADEEVAERAWRAAGASEDPPPTGFASWKDAALSERVRRVAAEKDAERYRIGRINQWISDVREGWIDAAIKDAKKEAGND